MQNVRVIVGVLGALGLLHPHTSEIAASRITTSYSPGDPFVRTVAPWEASVLAVVQIPNNAPWRVVEMSYIASYDCRMPVLNFRTDERSERALAELMADGSSASDAIRQALVDAVRLRRREQMRIESLEMMNDEADRAESRKVLAEMDELRAW